MKCDSVFSCGYSGSLGNEECTSWVPGRSKSCISSSYSLELKDGSILPGICTRQGEAHSENQAWLIEEESLEKLFCYQKGIIPQGVKLEEDPSSAG